MEGTRMLKLKTTVLKNDHHKKDYATFYGRSRTNKKEEDNILSFSRRETR